MTYDPASPRYTLELAGKPYNLVGTFAVIEAAENALKDHILNIPGKCVQMPVSDMVKLLAAILSSCGHKVTNEAIADVIWNQIGIDSGEYALLGLHIYAFLSITIAKPKEREAAAERMGEMFRKMADKSASSATIDASA